MREGEGRNDCVVPLDQRSQATRVHKARRNGPRSADKGQSHQDNKGLGEERRGEEAPGMYR